MATQITRIIDRAHEGRVRELESEYFAWVNAQLQGEFQIRLDVERMIAGDMEHLNIYFPPDGGLFLAEADGGLAGMIFLTRLRGDAGQIRRMYVRDEYRRRGVARALFGAAIREARAIGYARLLLESPVSWRGAHALYREMGFGKVVMYPESEVPEPLRGYWVFMEKTL
ncbi:GNAT family N-acetyltransferase [Deinococcus sp. YIM 134068]|uniref:GNAT family N-acetyltransferase n=1 Tax=Deinococcus lichenicola TaxID=3118910 RepID=UPI002F923839